MAMVVATVAVTAVAMAVAMAVVMAVAMAVVMAVVAQGATAQTMGTAMVVAQGDPRRLSCRSWLTHSAKVHKIFNNVAAFSVLQLDKRCNIAIGML
jgi:hypothetical protein